MLISLSGNIPDKNGHVRRKILCILLHAFSPDPWFISPVDAAAAADDNDDDDDAVGTSDAAADDHNDNPFADITTSMSRLPSLSKEDQWLSEHFPGLDTRLGLPCVLSKLLGCWPLRGKTTIVAILT